MRIFSIFKKRKVKAQQMPLADILRATQEYVPEFYWDTQCFKESREFLSCNELLLALDSLIKMASESGDYFSVDFWSDLQYCADKLQADELAYYCKRQIIVNNRGVPRGMTFTKITKKEEAAGADGL
jgi:hypothetical protein